MQNVAAIILASTNLLNICLCYSFEWISNAVYCKLIYLVSCFGEIYGQFVIVFASTRIFSETMCDINTIINIYIINETAKFDI